MKKFVLLSISLMVVTFITAQTWVQKNDFPGTERYGATGFSLNGKIYFGTGYNGVTLMNDWWEYDPVMDQWTQKASLPASGRFHTTSFEINGKGYLVFGSTSYSPYTFLNELWEYDPVANQWLQKASCPGVGRNTAVGFAVNGKGYVGTGWKQASPAFLNDWWEYDSQTNTWTQKSNFPGGARQSASSFVLNGNGYVSIGGAGSNLFNDLWVFDPVNDSWSQKAHFPGGLRTGAASFELNGFGFIGSGDNGEFGSGMHTDFFKYEPVTNIWSSVSGIFPGRLASVATSIGDCGYIITGLVNYTPTPQSTLKDVWELCLLTGMEENIFTKEITIFPNPWRDNVHLNFTANRKEIIEINIYNTLGVKIAEVFKGEVMENKNYSISSNFGPLSSGVYVISFRSENSNSNYKIIKH